MSNRTTLVFAVAAGLLLASAHAPAPAGPVAPTHKTLTQVEPRIPIGPDTTPGNSATVYHIFEPGSYYLTGDVTGVAGRHGILVSAPDVTIDLNGFRLQGVAGSSHGIFAQSTARNLVVRDGVLIGWDDAISGQNNPNARYERIRIDGCRGRGIVAGMHSVVADCTVYDCADEGIRGSDFCTVTRCTVSACETGILLLATGKVTDCLLENNTLHGVFVGSRGLIRGNHCVFNGNSSGGAGIYVPGQFNRIEGNSLVQNGRGIQVTGTRNVIVSNSASFNANNYTIGETNTVGPITSDLAAASAWANIAH